MNFLDFMKTINAPINSIEIALLEKDLKIKLPPIYKLFLTQTNGGTLKRSDFDLCEVDKEYVGGLRCPFHISIDYFFYVAEAREVTELEYVKEFLQRGLFPIAEILGGDTVFIGLEGFEITDKVIFYSPDFRSDYSEYGELIVAENIYQFLINCKNVYDIG